MRITVINGNMHHGSTWHCKDLLVQKISELAETQVTEFYLPKDMSDFCSGCFSCFLKGEETCPHADQIRPIVAALAAADLVILTSPVYGLDVSGQLKALLDHLCFMWISHRPNPKMFNTVGISLTTTAGAGLSHTTKTMQNSLKYWGIKKCFASKQRVAAMTWSEIPAKKRGQIEKEMQRLAQKVTQTVTQIEHRPSPLFRKVMFNVMKQMMKDNHWNPIDRNHWEAHGWLTGNKPF
ncbi:flavodoxin family protein [Acetobacterium woodii]|uniref:Putative NADPH-dependent FMN reductase n=1 Tax=Acetobacterium woodii (strain ATCC 29683 / DSM 1030 / JCM 2381 / KCTC 1655 / WB1) TaxID=931626 RepID=H6LIZ4_ACEWD|nr:NAD(P)H-dependent oxidoreductase [Acetobacterium woodii]AFA47357.1 putative NADPH-dependent FMN reductase [Acetobacterium woodii DSM 1030]